MTRFESFIGAVKRYWYRYVVITLLLSLVAGIWLEWREEQAAAVARIEADYSAVISKQIEWLNLSSVVISDAARADAVYPDRQSLAPLYDAVKMTLDQMTSFYTPTGTIAESAKSYRDALQDVAGSINQYSPNNESMERLLNSLQVAANVGGDFQSNVDDYRTDAWRAFISVIL